MNKQEAINELKKYKVGFGEAAAVRFDRIVSVINQIHEPQKVVVPEFVASWLKYAKTTYCSLGRSLRLDEVDTANYANWAKDRVKLYGWMASKKNQETFTRAWLDGYEVEQEKLYTVEIPDPNRPDTATFLYKENGKAFIGSDIFLDEVPNYKWKKEPENQLTESEIKEDFEWAWQFAEEVE